MNSAQIYLSQHPDVLVIQSQIKQIELEQKIEKKKLCGMIYPIQVVTINKLPTFIMAIYH